MRYVKWAGLGLLALLAALLIWGIVIEPRLIDEVQETANIPDLPADWQGKKIALIADFQVGMWLGNEGTVRRIVQRLVKAKPAAVLIAGDFIYHPTEDDSVSEALEEFDDEDKKEVTRVTSTVKDMLRPLTEAQVPVYAVLGNHDYAMEKESAIALPWVADLLTAELQKINVRVLRNESMMLPSTGGSQLYLVGIGPVYPGRANVSKALAGVPKTAPRIVFMHNPDAFKDIPAGAAPLALAAHTHGGQIRVPFRPDWTWLQIVKKGQHHVDGWIQNYGAPRNKLYVNRGIGFSTLPIRINCLPELTYLTLERASPS